MESEKVALVSSDDFSNNSAHATNGQYGSLVEAEINGKWKSRWKSLFPTGFMKETGEIYRLTWPIYVSNVFSYIAGSISMVFSGHLGTVELASVSMATSLINISALSVVQGLSTACYTLFPQAFGGENKKALGVYLQRGIIILSLSCLPCWAIHLNARQFLLLLGQDPEVARLTGEYMLIFLPGFLFTVVQQVLAQYLQVQGMLKPLILIGLLANGLNILMQYVLVYVVQMGIYGSSLSQTITYLAMLVLTLLYIIVWKKYKATWPGWTWKCLENWDVFIKLSIAGLFMTMLEIWIYEIGVFLSGLLGTVELAASATCLQIQTVLYLVSMSLGAAASIRVGCNLGAGSADGAKTASRVTLTYKLVMDCHTGDTNSWDETVRFNLGGNDHMPHWNMNIPPALVAGLCTFWRDAIQDLQPQEPQITSPPTHPVHVVQRSGVTWWTSAYPRELQYTCTVMMFIVEAILLLSLMSVTPYIFTSDVSVADLASSLIPIACIFIFCGSITQVSEATLQGAGRQFIGALVNTSTYACIALPMIVVLMFVVKIGPAGFWWGVAIGQLPAALIYLIIVAQMNWKAEVDKVGTRILTTDMVISVEVNGLNDVTTQKAALLDGSTLRANSNTNGNSTFVSQPKPREMYNGEEETGANEVTTEPETLCYLICKRVAVFFMLLAILVAGILTRVLIPVPEASIKNSTLTNSTD